jgi:hypothetical protein
MLILSVLLAMTAPSRRERQEHQSLTDFPKIRIKQISEMRDRSDELDKRRCALPGSRPILPPMSQQPPVRRGSDGRALPSRWMIYQVASRQTWIGEVDAATEAEAVKKAAEKFNMHNVL